MRVYLQLGQRSLHLAESRKSADEENLERMRRLLNAAARVVLGPPAEVAPVDREAAADPGVQEAVKTRVLHPGREGVERVVPVLPKRKGRRGKALLPGEVVL